MTLRVNIRKINNLRALFCSLQVDESKEYTEGKIMRNGESESAVLRPSVQSRLTRRSRWLTRVCAASAVWRTFLQEEEDEEERLAVLVRDTPGLWRSRARHNLGVWEP